MKSKALNVVSGADLKKGNDVLTIGYPLLGLQGQEQKATFGHVNALSGIKGDIRFIQIDVPIQPGNSGGPLIGSKGNVVGVVTAMLDQINTLRATGALPQSVNYAIKSDCIIPLLSGKSLYKPSLSANLPKKEISELVQDLEDSVVLVAAE